MSKAIIHKMPLFQVIQGEEQKAITLSFRVKPSQEQRWKEAAQNLGVHDFSSFIRGAVESAIFSAQRAQDPQWQKFVEAIQPTAQKVLGHGFYDGGAGDFESGGQERIGTPAKAFLKGLKQKVGKKPG
jgi:uncharacterized protein (DUF1778 family)